MRDAYTGKKKSNYRKGKKKQQKEKHENEGKKQQSRVWKSLYRSFEETRKRSERIKRKEQKLQPESSLMFFRKVQLSCNSNTELSNQGKGCYFIL